MIPTGVGLGLRWENLEDLETRPDDLRGLPFVEVSPENYVRRGGYYPAALRRIRDEVPILSHGLTMSLGGTDPLDDDYFRRLSRFLVETGATYHSDHLCWSGAGGSYFHELLPLPFTEDAVKHVAARHREAQDRIGVPLAIENVTYYAAPAPGTMREEEFVRAVLEETGAKILLDVNNVWVNAKNHGFDPVAWLDTIPMDRVVQLHVAGHERWESDALWVDTHGAPVEPRTVELMKHVVRRTGPVPVLLERDQNVPELDELLAEVKLLRGAYEEALRDRA